MSEFDDETIEALEKLPTYSKEDARCWNCGSTKYRAGTTDPNFMGLRVISCTDCNPKGEIELQAALEAAVKQ